MHDIKNARTFWRNVAALFFSVLLISYGGGVRAESTTAITFNISGKISGATQQGVTLTLTGGATATTDASGSYSFSGLANGNYTITPTRAGYKFKPASTAISVSNADVSSTNFLATSRLNDTGITSSQCYEAGSDALVDCRSAGAIALNDAQDGMVGRDANPATNKNADGKLGFSFSKVPGGCVQDNVTGLMWEVKTADGGLRDWQNTYTNFDNPAADQKPSTKPQLAENPRLPYEPPTKADIDAPTNSIGFLNSVNSQALCGFSDWRMPAFDELKTIVDYGVAYPGPAIDTSTFPNSHGEAYWSGSPNGGHPEDARAVYFDKGVLADLNRRAEPIYVRLVRTGTTASSEKGYRLTGWPLQITGFRSAFMPAKGE